MEEKYKKHEDMKYLVSSLKTASSREKLWQGCLNIDFASSRAWYVITLHTTPTPQLNFGISDTNLLFSAAYVRHHHYRRHIHCSYIKALT